MNLCSITKTAGSVTLSKEFKNAVHTLMTLMKASKWNNFYEFLAESFIKSKPAASAVERFDGSLPERIGVDCQSNTAYQAHHTPNTSPQPMARIWSQV